MEFKRSHIEISADNILSDAKERKASGWRYVQILAVFKDDKIDLVYSYMKEGLLEDVLVYANKKGDTLQSISCEYLEAFVCENEINDLYGIHFDNLKIDFKGNFYALSEDQPMTVISAVELKRREKEAKIKAALEAKKKKEAAAKTEDTSPNDIKEGSE